MRILVLGGNFAGLLSALQLHRWGGEISVLVPRQEAVLPPAPPMVFTDPGPWLTHQSAGATISAIANSQGDFRLGQGFMGQWPWLMRWLSHRHGQGARRQSMRALALARHSKLLYDELHAEGCLPEAAEALRQISVYEHAETAQAHFERGPVWHMGPSRPSLSPLSDHADWLPAMDLQGAQQEPTLTSGGMMVSDSAQVVQTLRHHLRALGVRFMADHAIESVDHVNGHLHGVTVRGPQNRVEELDTDLVVAASVPAAWPLLKALNLKPNLALLKTFGLRAQNPDGPTEPLFLHERKRGIRLIRQGSTVWAQGPTWLGEPGLRQAAEAAHLTGRMAHYLGPKCKLLSDVPWVQSSWVAPDGLPIVERSTTRNLFLNIGHHSATATMALGSAFMLRTLVDRALNTHRSVPIPARLTPADGSAAGYSLGQIHA